MAYRNFVFKTKLAARTVNAQTAADNQAGFTLVEAIVATGVFATMVAAIIGIYLSAVKINRKTDMSRTLSESARFISEFLSKEIKNGDIDFNSGITPCTPPLRSSDPKGHYISLINVDGDSFCIYTGRDDGIADSPPTPSSPGNLGTNLWMKKNTLSAVRLHPPNVSLASFIVYINPPYDPCPAPPACDPALARTEPSVTLVFSLKTNTAIQEIVSAPVQTTISIPRYDFP